MSKVALSPEDSRQRQELESLMRAAQILDHIRSLALPVAAVGLLVSLLVGPGSFIAGALLGASGIVAARAFNRTKAATMRKTLEELRGQGTVSPEQYEKWRKLLNSIETDQPEESPR